MIGAEIQRDIIHAAEQMGFTVFRLNSGKPLRYNVRLCPPGTPDLLIVGAFGALWVEVKMAGERLRETQKDMHAELRRYGQKVVIARSVDDYLFAVGHIDDL